MKEIICFISCVNDKDLYEKCLQHIKKLDIPEGYEIDVIAIYDAKSLTSGYNRAMVKSNAKYKVYLHQDTFIVNENFINDILEIFSKDCKIGMLGMAGAENIPISGEWGRSKKRKGKVIEGRADGKRILLNLGEIYHEYENVVCIDGLLMATQYDIPWREDLFDGWDFYDVSQCMEFIRAQYQVCIPTQEESWCIHDCGELNMENYDKYRRIFLKEYAKDLFLCGNLFPTIYNWNKKIRPYQKKIEMLAKKIIKK